jgi:uncharacterized protein
MKIIISDIPEEGLVADLEEKISLEDVLIASPVKAQLAVSKTSSEVIITGGITAELDLKCSRCLKTFRQVLDLPVNVVYHPAGEVCAERHQLHDDEMDMEFYRADELDLNELLSEQIMLNEQMKPLCDEACKGICPECGTDLNTGSCRCVQKKTDPRLEVLKKLLDKGKE